MDSNNQINRFKDNVNFEIVISEIIANQLILECEVEALKRVLVTVLSEMEPNHRDAVAQNKGYLSILKKVFDSKIENHNAFSKEMTEHLRSQLKDLPGIDLPSL